MPGLAKLAAQLRLDRTVAAAALLSVTALIASSTPSAAFVETARQADWVHATHSHHDHHAPAGANTIGRGIGGLHGRLAANQPVEEAAAYCADRFRSYDASSGTYLGYDGYEHACP